MQIIDKVSFHKHFNKEFKIVLVTSIISSVGIHGQLGQFKCKFSNCISSHRISIYSYLSTNQAHGKCNACGICRVPHSISRYLIRIVRDLVARVSFMYLDGKKCMRMFLF